MPGGTFYLRSMSWGGIMSIDQNWRETQISHVQAGIVAMENLLDDGDRDDVVYVLGNIISILGQIHVPDGMTEEVVDRLDEAQESLEAAHSLMGGAE